MQLLYISRYQFKKSSNKTYAIPAYNNEFWKKYLDVFDKITVLGEYVKNYLDNGTLAEITDSRISVEILPRNVLPHEFINDKSVKSKLEEHIKRADAILIKPTSRKGLMAIKLAEKYNKPYMIELTGDLHLTLKNNPNILKRIYNPFLHMQVLHTIKNCRFGLYVTEKYLQNVYPISGKQCGCTDTVLSYISEDSLTKRLAKIENMTDSSEIKIGMVASYHDARKGIDTAIKALNLINDKRISLHILGLGTKEDRNKWFKFAKRYGVKEQLYFDPSLSNAEDVLLWNDDMDLCILPSRSEGLPRCIVESLSRACPVITSSVCGMPELVGEEWTHSPNNSKHLAALISKMISVRELMKNVAVTNFNHSKNYEFNTLKAHRNAFLNEFKEYCAVQKENSELLYISTFMFYEENNEIYALPSCCDSFFSKYLDVFDSVRVLGEKIKGFLDKSVLVKMESDDISVRILPANTQPKDFKNDRALKKLLTEEISKATAILIKPSSRRGIMAIKIAKKLNKPYMIEMTGDIHNALMQSPNLIKRMYSPILYMQVKKAIADCKFGLYVSRDYLQGKFPIIGKECACSDVILETPSDDILQKRLEKIDTMQSDGVINLALIGFYQGNGKGIDTALRALSRLPENYHLSVLGNGTEENRKKWYEYGRAHGVSKNRLHFPDPLPSAKHVLNWLDDFDFFVLPTRSEGLPRVIVEAMSRAIPCFATNICTMPELLPAECLFELDDDEKLAELLLSYSNNKELMKKTAATNFENAKKYDFGILKNRRNEFLSEFKNYCLDVNRKS